MVTNTNYGYTIGGITIAPTGGIIADPGRTRKPPVIKPPTGGIVPPQPPVKPPVIKPPTGGIVPPQPPVTPPDEDGHRHHRRPGQTNDNNQLLNLLMQIIMMMFGGCNPMSPQQPPIYWAQNTTGNQGLDGWY